MKSHFENLVRILRLYGTRTELINKFQKKAGRVGAIGMADLTVEELEFLVEWSSICPDLMQICPLTYDSLFADKNSTVKKIMKIGQTKSVRITTHK